MKSASGWSWLGRSNDYIIQLHKSNNTPIPLYCKPTPMCLLFRDIYRDSNGENIIFIAAMTIGASLSTQSKRTTTCSGALYCSKQATTQLVPIRRPPTRAPGSIHPRQRSSYHLHDGQSMRSSSMVPLRSSSMVPREDPARQYARLRRPQGRRHCAQEAWLTSCESGRRSSPVSISFQGRSPWPSFS